MKKAPEIVVLGSPSYNYLAEKVAKAGKWRMVDVTWGSYPGGHSFHRLDRSAIRGKRVVIVGGTIDTAERDSILNAASTLIRLEVEELVIANPCMGTQRDEKWTLEAQHPAAKLELRQFSSLPRASSVELLLFDLHNESVSLYGEGDLLVVPCRFNNVTKQIVKDLKGTRVGSTDIGGRGRARRLAEQTNLTAVYCDKERLSPTKVEVKVASSRGLIKDQRIIMIDDILETGTTADAAAKAYLESGAKEVLGVFSHALCSSEHVKALKKHGHIKKIVITNSRPQAAELAKEFPNFIEVCDISQAVCDAIVDPWGWLE